MSLWAARIGFAHRRSFLASRGDQPDGSLGHDKSPANEWPAPGYEPDDADGGEAGAGGGLTPKRRKMPSHWAIVADAAA